MKIGIVTCGDYWNYGNRLQNFVLKYIIETHHSREVISIKWIRKRLTSMGRRSCFLEKIYSKKLTQISNYLTF